MARFLLILFFYLPGHSAVFEVVGPCSDKPLIAFDLPVVAGESVGQFTVRALELSKLPYQGSDRGIKSIAGTPVGDEAIEIISDEEMRAYGWCYQQNGVEPGVYPHEVTVQSQDKILWQYGYSLYKRGQWLTMCDPAWQIKPDFLCAK